MIVALFYMIGVFFIFFFAKNLQMLLAAEILCGIPWGSESSSWTAPHPLPRTSSCSC
jgi:hypothetical protein